MSTHSLKNISVLLMTAVMMLLQTACSVYDDYTWCSSGKLLFSYMADGETNVIGRYIHGAQVFIYNADNELVYQGSVSQKELESPDGLRLPNLLEGKYRIVVWGNAGDNTVLDQSNNLNSFAAKSKQNASGELQANDPLYFGTADLVVAPGQGSPSTTVNLASAHINIEVSAFYFENIYGAGISPVVKIENAGISYPSNQTGMPVASGRETYVLPVTYQASDKKHVASLQAFRFTDENDIAIAIYHPQSGELLRKISLKEYLQSNVPPISVNGRQEVNISVVVEFTALGVVVRPPTWQGEEITPGL